MARIKKFMDYLDLAKCPDLLKINLFTHSDKFSFSHVDHIVKAAGAFLFNYICPPGIFDESINGELPVYNYGNFDEIKKLIEDGIIDKKNVYNDPDNLVNANDKVVFHKKMSGFSFVPKTVFDLDNVNKLKFPVIAKPSNGSKGQGIVVFKDAEELKDADKDVDFGIFSEKFNLQKEFRIICLRSKMLYVAERIPVNKKAMALRESEDIFMRDGTMAERSGYKWVTRSFGKGDLTDTKGLTDICQKTCKALGLDILGIDVGLDEKGKMHLIEANTCPGLNSDQIVKIYLGIFEDYYGRLPERNSMDKIKSIAKELKRVHANKIKFSFHNIPGRRMDWGIEDVASSSVKYDLEKSFGDTFVNMTDDNNI